MSEVAIVEQFVPGAIGRVVELHGRYYHEHWGFGRFFEARVSAEMGEFARRFDAARDGFWVALAGGRIEGSITLDGVHADDAGAHLRWFIVSDALRGTGVGRRLVDRAMAFSADRGYGRVYLDTFAGLDAARRLYEQAGFRLVDQRRGAQWGTEVEEQRFVRELG